MNSTNFKVLFISLILHITMATDKKFKVSKTCNYGELVALKCTSENFEDSVCKFHDNSHRACICSFSIFMNIKIPKCEWEDYDIATEGDPFKPQIVTTTTNGTNTGTNIG